MNVFRTRSLRSMTPGDLEVAVSSGAQVVDVRTDEEWEAGHLPFASHVELDRLADHLDELRRDVLTVVVCRSGRRSADAARALARAGFEVANLAGGVQACRAAGLPLVRHDGSAGTVA